MDKRLIIKYGGNAMHDSQSLHDFASAMASLKQQGTQIGVVHGGGPQITHCLDRLQIESHFIDGQRYTDAATLEVVEMILCGQVNNALLRAFLQEGIAAMGISGQSNGLLRVEDQPRLGLVGAVTSVKKDVLELLLRADITPIIAPLGLNDAEQVRNVNADWVAAAIAASLAAPLLLLSNVSGLLDGQGERISCCNSHDIERMIDDGSIQGGMIPKTRCALYALQHGAESVRILDGRKPRELPQLLRNKAGTLIVLA